MRAVRTPILRWGSGRVRGPPKGHSLSMDVFSVYLVASSAAGRALHFRRDFSAPAAAKEAGAEHPQEAQRELVGNKTVLQQEVEESYSGEA